jgi:hypothetical protein
LFGKDGNISHFQNSDIAYRACAYRKLNLLTVEDINLAYQKDGLIAVEYLMLNMEVWRDALLRECLSDICWDADGKFNRDYLDCANSFNRKKEELELRYPDWFSEEVVVDDDDKLVNVGLFRELSKESQQELLTIVSEFLDFHFKKQGKVLGWIFYGILAAIVIVLMK